MEIHNLKDLSGKTRKFRGFEPIKPEVGSLIRVIRDSSNPVSINKANVYNNLSMDRVYEVFKVFNEFEVFIKDDQDITVRLTKSLYQVVEEISDKEIKNFTDLISVLKSFDNVIKK
ncbi:MULTISPECIES: hypothetical protein [Clostridia]|uniref:hypothetical protein n=1 Tax=Clostridia TaxID=186801 RepID=UPI000EA2820D|nr:MULTISPECIES: hypothetical protein [Clostridia]NBJ68317.1 hypothetical protein [Roseburia sp. 1XD42-34]RKI81407.1 hypothetical protein D7V87_02355 [Clostridium sp. 1xD42-85]